MRKISCKSRFFADSGRFPVCRHIRCHIGVLEGFPLGFGISDVSGGSRVAASTSPIIIYHLFLLQDTQESLRRVQNAPELEIPSEFARNPQISPNSHTLGKAPVNNSGTHCSPSGPTNDHFQGRFAPLLFLPAKRGA